MSGSTKEVDKREYWHDPVAGVVREIWRAGDGDGRLEDDMHGSMLVPPMERRWRLYLSNLEKVEPGEIEPPKHVILDDKAAYQVFTSQLSRASIVRHWGQDFAGKGGIRRGRIHRGNPAIVDEAAEGMAKYGRARQGKHKLEYTFRGEKGFKPLTEGEAFPDKALEQKRDDHGAKPEKDDSKSRKRKSDVAH